MFLFLALILINDCYFFVFSPEKDLTPMVGEMNNNVEISKINHKVKFDVDENGIEGAAVTAVEISFRTIST